jgi:hypothetical protein
MKYGASTNYHRSLVFSSYTSSSYPHTPLSVGSPRGLYHEMEGGSAFPWG